MVDQAENNLVAISLENEKETECLKTVRDMMAGMQNLRNINTKVLKYVHSK